MECLGKRHAAARLAAACANGGVVLWVVGGCRRCCDVRACSGVVWVMWVLGDCGRCYDVGGVLWAVLGAGPGISAFYRGF